MNRETFPTAVVKHFANSASVESVVLEADAYGHITFNSKIAVHMFRLSGTPSVFCMDILIATNIPLYRINVVDNSGAQWTQLHQFCSFTRMVAPASDPTLRISLITQIGPQLVLDASRIVIPCTVIRCTRTQRCQRIVAIRSVPIVDGSMHILTLYMTTGPLVNSITIHSAMAQHMLRSCTFDNRYNMYRCNDAVSPEAIAASDVGLPLTHIDELDAELESLWRDPPTRENDAVDALWRMENFNEITL